MLSISIDGSDDDLQSLTSESFGPEAVSAAIAEVAREALAEAEAINTAALGKRSSLQDRYSQNALFCDGKISGGLPS